MRVNTDDRFRMKKGKCFLILIVTSVIVPILVSSVYNSNFFVQHTYAADSAGDQVPTVELFSLSPSPGYLDSPALFTATSAVDGSSSGSGSSEEIKITNAFVEVAETTTTAADQVTYSIGEICGNEVDDNTNGQTDEGCNLSPDCSTAVPSQAVLFSTDHHVEEINIEGAVDPNNDPVVLIITDIIQDEPTNGLGNDDQTPDALLSDGDTVQLRSERAEHGDGRVYYISFVANDGKGGQCDGVVAVSVPNNQIGMAIDSGTYFSSLQ